MRMTREKKYLMRAAQVANGLERRSASAGIEIDEDVVTDDRQWIDMVRVLSDQSKPHRQIQLLGRTAAQELRLKADPVRTLHLDLAAIERSDYASVTSFGHYIEKRRGLSKNFRL